MVKNNWIKDAVKRPEALTAKAERAGMTISKYCSQKTLDLETQKQCTLAKTLKSFKK
jgi:hypothetical protein